MSSGQSDRPTTRRAASTEREEMYLLGVALLALEAITAEALLADLKAESQSSVAAPRPSQPQTRRATHIAHHLGIGSILLDTADLQVRADIIVSIEVDNVPDRLLDVVERELLLRAVDEVAKGRRGRGDNCQRSEEEESEGAG